MIFPYHKLYFCRLENKPEEEKKLQGARIRLPLHGIGQLSIYLSGQGSEKSKGWPLVEIWGMA